MVKQTSVPASDKWPFAQKISAILQLISANLHSMLWPPPCCSSRLSGPPSHSTLICHNQSSLSQNTSNFHTLHAHSAEPPSQNENVTSHTQSSASHNTSTPTLSPEEPHWENPPGNQSLQRPLRRPLKEPKDPPWPSQAGGWHSCNRSWHSYSSSLV